MRSPALEDTNRRTSCATAAAQDIKRNKTRTTARHRLSIRAVSKFFTYSLSPSPSRMELVGACTKSAHIGHQPRSLDGGQRALRCCTISRRRRKGARIRFEKRRLAATTGFGECPEPIANLRRGTVGPTYHRLRFSAGTAVSALLLRQLAGFIDDDRVTGSLEDRCPRAVPTCSSGAVQVVVEVNSSGNLFISYVLGYVGGPVVELVRIVEPRNDDHIRCALVADRRHHTRQPLNVPGVARPIGALATIILAGCCVAASIEVARPIGSRSAPAAQKLRFIGEIENDRWVVLELSRHRLPELE